jgi:hypothetical protein
MDTYEIKVRDVSLVVEYTYEYGQKGTYFYEPIPPHLYIHKIYLDSDPSKTDITDLLEEKVYDDIEDEITEYEDSRTYDDVYEDFKDDFR